MRTIRSLLWIGTGRGLCESGMTEAPELDVTWVPSVADAMRLPRVRFDGVLFEAAAPDEIERVASALPRWGPGTQLLVCLPERCESQVDAVLARGAAAALFCDPDLAGPGLVSEIGQALDALHEHRLAELPGSRSPLPCPTASAPAPPPNVIPFVAPTDALDASEARASVAGTLEAPVTPEEPPAAPTPRNPTPTSNQASRVSRRGEEPLAAPEPVETEGGLRVVFSSRAMQEVSELIDLAASSPSTVLLTGETGVGKEVVARQLHARSCREDEPFVAINCAAFPESLLESELFGHAKGAFTGADRAKVGLFEAAGSGTLFLDEIAEMELTLQAKLLRVLQEREVRPVGGTRSIALDCRIVAATNRVLSEEVAAGHFREDLFYRLNVFPVRIPPLRERRPDILPLARYFLTLHGPRENKHGCHLSLASAQLLEAYTWPGNVRELENEILRVLMITPSGQLITPRSLSAKIVEVLEPIANGARPDESLREALERVESWLIRRALANNGGRKARTARKLGLTREGLYRKLKRLGIE